MQRKAFVVILLVCLVILGAVLSTSTAVGENPSDSFNVIKTKILGSGDNQIHGFTYYDGHLWASTRTNPCRILKIDPDTLDYERIILDSRLNDGEDIISANGYIWVILCTNPSRVVKIDPDTLNWEVAVTFKSNELRYGGSLEYAFGYLWAGGRGKLAKINLNSLSYDVCDFSNVVGDAQFHALSSGGGYIWGSCSSAKRILRINPDNPTDYDSLYLGVPITDDMAYSNGYLYAGSEVTPSFVYRISDTLTYNRVKASDTICYGIFYHNDRIWGAYVGTPGKLAEFDLNLNLIGVYKLQSYFNNANEVVFDKTGNLYVTCWGSPAKIVKLSVLNGVDRTNDYWDTSGADCIPGSVHAWCSEGDCVDCDGNCEGGDAVHFTNWLCYKGKWDKCDSNSIGAKRGDWVCGSDGRWAKTGFICEKSQTIGPDGGTLAVDDFSLIVPSGAFASNVELELSASSEDRPFGDYGVSRTFRLDGLPLDYYQPLQVRIKYQGTLSGESFIAIGEEGFAKSLNAVRTGYNLLPATESSGYLICELPASKGDIGTFGKSRETIEILQTTPPGGATTTTLQAVTGYETSSAGHFNITYPKKLAADAKKLAGYLEEAYNKFKAMGFDYSARTRWPVDVTVIDLTADNAVGIMEDHKKGNNYDYLEFDTNSMNDHSLMRVTAGHEFFHLVQSLYDPRNPKEQAEETACWLWLDEACSVWSEEKFTSTKNYVSSAREGNEMAPFNGMHEDDGEHGYGMSAMIKYFVNKHGESVLVDIYKYIQNEDHPVNAIINSCPDPEKWWPDFLKEYTLGNIYNDVKPEFFNYHLSDTFEIKSESDTSKTFSGEYGDLSGKVYLIDLATHRKVDPEASIQIDVSSEDSEGVQVSVFKWCPGKIGYLEGPADSLAIPDVKVLADQWWDLLVLVTNSRNVWEYDELSEIDLEIEVGVEGAEGAEVNIPDPCLRKAINEDIGRAEDDTNPIEKSELEEKVFSLVWQNWDGCKCSINSLSGIEYCVNLVSLYLHGSQITDISALSGLTNLKNLDLSDNQLADISALSGLTNLEHLDLYDNQIADISALSDLTNLTGLNLKNNQITDISALSRLTNLTGYLGLKNNRITDISALSGLTNLETLSLSDNQIADISALPAPTGGFIGLYLENNQITDISPLVANPGLRRGSFVNLRGNPLDHNGNPDNGPTEDYDNVRALRERGVMVDW